MIYSPHILQVKRTTTGEDEWGNPLPSSSSWETIGECRCDDNSTKEFRGDNGHVYRPNFHVVGENLNVKPGEEVRCMSGDVIRGEGVVYTVKQSNYLEYTELWM